MENKILFVQFRKEKDIKDHERKVFKDIYKYSSIQFIDINTKNLPPIEQILNYSAIILGGSSYRVNKGQGKKIVKEIGPIINTLIKRKIPILGICFGCQLLTIAQGGKVSSEKKMEEYGTFLTQLIEPDHIVVNMPNRFHVQCGHTDFISKISPGAKAISLGLYGQPHLIKFPNFTYGVLFHPELNKERMIQHGKFYFTEGKLNIFKKGLKETPFSHKVLDNFIKYIVKKQNIKKLVNLGEI